MQKRDACKREQKQQSEASLNHGDMRRQLIRETILERKKKMSLDKEQERDGNL